MPLTHIETRRPRTAAEVDALLDAVHDALVAALRIPEDDGELIYTEHPPERFRVSPGRSEDYVLVRVTMFAGRSVEAKRALYRELVERLGALGIDPLDVFIVLVEPPLENWGLRGGRSAADVDLGFRVDV